MSTTTVMPSSNKRRVIRWAAVLLPYVLLALALVNQRQATAPPVADHYALQTQLFDLYQPRQASVVMLGDSLTYHADWPELLGRSDVVRRAIPGDSTAGALARLDSVLALHPRTVVILLGTNDLQYQSAADTWTTYQRILNTLIAHDVTPIIVTTPPVAEWHPQARTFNPRAADLNARLSDYADSHDLGVIALHAIISEHPEWLAADGVHLTAPAYAAWRAMLLDALQATDYGT